MVFKDIKKVMVDFDGTLVDSKHCWVEIYRLLYVKNGVSFPVELEKKYGLQPFETWSSIVEDALQKECQFTEEDIISCAKEIYRKCKPKQKIMTMLGETAECDIEIITMEPCEIVEDWLKHYNITIFDRVTTVRENRENPEFYKENGLLLIDDNYRHCKAAKTAGATVIGVEDYHNEEQKKQMREICDFYMEENMYYSIYYMTTPRCILNCGYCFRDTTPESIASELPVEKIKELITHLYENFNVRKLTISGGEPTVLGGVKNKNFLELINHLRKFKHQNEKDNLRIELLSNAVNLTPDITEQLVGVVDRITITLDSLDESVLSKIGRNTGPYKDYVSRFRERFADFTEKGFDLKLHSVVTPVNYDSLIPLVTYIKDCKEFHVSRWKFYQYMTYGQPEKDLVYAIEDEKYTEIAAKISEILSGSGIELSFKDNKLMTDTMFNLLHSGRLEYFTTENGVRTRHLSDILTSYSGWDELAEKCCINREMIKKYHSYGGSK